MNILLLQIYDNSCKELHELTKPSCINYCQHYQMDYIAVNLNDLNIQYQIGDVKLKYLHPAWAKIWVLAYINYEKYDYIWVLDIDVIILNKNIDICSYFLNLNNDYQKIICSINGDNGGSLLNTGSIIYHKDSIIPFLHKFKDFLLTNNHYDKLNKPFWEQDFINDYYEKNPYLFKVLQMNDINSWWFNYSPQQLLFHFMARSYDDKLKVANEILNNSFHLK